MNTEQRNSITEEQAAALVLLKSTGLEVLQAAQLVAAVVARVEAAAELPATRGRAPQAKGKRLVPRCMEIVELGLAAKAARENTVSLEEAGWASVEARSDCRPTTRRDLRYYLRRILRVPGASELPLRAMTTAQCRELLQAAFGNCKSMYIKGRVMLHSVFAYGMRREWCDANPVARIEVPKVEEKQISPLPVEDVQRLQKAAEKPEHRDMSLSLHLLLFNGIRPAEVSRLRAEDFCWEEKLLYIRPQKSKTGGGRVVPLRGLGAPMQTGACPIPQNWNRRWRALRRAAGFEAWVPDVCRHSFASYHAAHFRNLPELQLEMGHRDSELLRTRYVCPVPRQAAKDFWQLAGKANRRL